MTNVLVVVLDSVRAQSCSLHGAPHETTPFLDTLAAEATTYRQARAPSNWTVPSHASLLTGLDAHEHRLTVHDRLRPGHTVVEALAADGHDTGLFSANGFLSERPCGLGGAFETVVGVPDLAGDAPPDGFAFADRLLSWTAGRAGPWTACLTLMDAHRPYEPRDEFDRWADDRARAVQDELDVRWEWAFAGGERPDRDLDALESLYDGGIRQADAVVERVVERLRERGTLDETLLVVCADHGEAFGERGRLDGEPRRLAHIVPMGEELLHVPLVVRPPGGGDGDRVDAPASLARLPEVARGHVAGDPPTRGFAAGTVRATKQPVTADLRARYEAARGRAAPYLAPSHAVYEAADGAVRKRYHWGDAAGAFLVPEAGVVERAGGADADAVAGAFDAPDAGVAEPLPESSVTAETEERLAALGYH